jgi:essential nuclear protein 1
MATLLSKSTSSVTSSRHRNPLAEDLIATGPLRPQSKKRKASKRGDDVEIGFVDARSSRKILKIGQELAEEEEEGAKPPVPSTAFTFESRFNASSDVEDDAPYEDAEKWEDGDEEDLREAVHICHHIASSGTYVDCWNRG